MVTESPLALVYGGTYVGTALLTAALGYWALTRTEMRSRGWFGALMAVLSVWMVIAAAAVFVTDPAIQEGLAGAWAAAGLSAVFVWLVFAVAYTGHDPRGSAAVRLFVPVYLGLLAVAVTTPVHDLYYQSLVVSHEPFPHVETVVGPARVLGLAYTFGGAGVGVYHLWQLSVSSRRGPSTQVLVLGMGLLAGLVPAVASLLGLTPVPTYDHTPLGVTVFALVAAYAVFRQSLSEFTPIARDIVVEEIEDPLFIVDADARLVDYNDAASRVVPALESDGIGTPVSTVLPQLEQAVESESPAELTRTVEGARRHYSVRVSEIPAQSSTRGYVVLLRDITERRARERELEAARHELEQSNERLDEFASVVSHDLRNPLNVATLRLEAARQERDSEHLERVAQAHHRMETLIEDMLTLTREEKRATELQDVPLAKVVSSCWRTVDTADVTLAVETERVIRADPDRLRQLLENLLRNAVEHGSTSTRTGPGRQANPTFTRSAAQPEMPGHHEQPQIVGDQEQSGVTSGQEQSGVTVTVGATADGFYVADDGPGIPESERERVLERGYSTAESGTGLGLAIVREIVAAHDWELTVTESQTGGARFEFTGVEVTHPTPPRE